MFERIVVPLDGTALAEQALAPAVSVAREEGTHLHLATVERSDTVGLEPAIETLDEQYLERVAARVREAGVPDVSARRLVGDKISDALEAHRKEVGAGLTVMCTHGRGAVERAWLGSVADEMIRSSEAPVLLVRAAPEGEFRDDDLGGARRFKRVLVALDGTHFSRQALEPAAQLGGSSGTSYVLAQVVPGSDASADERLEKGRVLAEAKMKLEAQSFAASGYDAEAVAECAPSVAQGILDLAERHEADLIVIATHGRSGVGRMILGSVTDKVVRGADLPVLVVRPREA